MPRVLHLVATGNFAGVERYVCTTAAETAARGYEVTVAGGHERRMRDALPAGVTWLPATVALGALGSLARGGSFDVCHAHMTVAEGVAVLTRPFHRAPIVSTRHFAAPRGSTPAGRLAAPMIASHIAREIAISEYVAKRIEAPPDAVIPFGVPPSPLLWREESRVALVLQRLEREKDTLTALRAWHISGLVEEGWVMRVVGDGAERNALEAWVRAEGVAGVTFAGWSAEVSQEYAAAGLLLASSPVDSFGLAIVEAMAAGVPVVACGAGGHLETVGQLPGAALFPPGDAPAAAAQLGALTAVAARRVASAAGRRLVEERFTVASHVDRLLGEYELAAGDSGVPPARSRRRSAPSAELRELVVCSLERWDDVWRRNQFFTDALLRRHPELRVLFLEPAADPLFDLASKRVPKLPHTRAVAHGGRLRTFRPLKPLPRKFGPLADRLVCRQVTLAARLAGFTRPLLWVNDVTFAPLIASTGWPALYDVTDDWLLAPFAPRERDRLAQLDALALRDADEVVVCSPALAGSRGTTRPVSLIPNGVDVEHFRAPQPRPRDLPASPVAIYVGTLHESRLDVDLVVATSESLPEVCFAFVGPDSLSAESHRRLAERANVVLLGARPYRDVPAYLQHADVVIVPHRISPFTESLDPIKAYECLAVRTPTVATPVAGFRELEAELAIAGSDRFASRVAEVLAVGGKRDHANAPPSWDERARAFEEVLLRALTPLETHSSAR